MLDSILGDIPTPLKFILAFAVVIALVLLAAWLMKRFSGNRFGPAAGAGRSRQPRLGVLDVLNIDGRRRLVIVRRDNVEHLVMIGGPNDVVVESGILRVPAGAGGQRDAPQIGPVDPQMSRTTPPQPVPAPAQSTRPQQPRAEAPAVQPAQRAAPTVQPAPPLVPSAPAPQPAAPQPAVSRPAPAPAVAPVRSAAQKPAAQDVVPQRPAPEARPVATQPAPTQQTSQAPQPIIAGPSARQAEPTVAPRSNELAERLAAALRRPVTPAARAPEPALEARPAPEPKSAPDVKSAPGPASAPEPKPARETQAKPGSGPAKPSAPQVAAPVEDLPREMQIETSEPPKGSAPQAAAAKPSAPDVRPEKRDDAGEDEFSLEADLANLLGRDLGKSKS